MNELALFAGAGGGVLGGKLLGWQTVCAVEIEPYCAGVLLQRQNDGILPPFPVWDDVCTFDGRPWRGIVDVISGGFPCQDISAAGKGAGITGERSGLWKEFARIIGEVRPRFVLVENSPVLTSRGLGVVLGDLAALGYDAQWGVLGAIEAGAPHKRDRIWIMAHPQGFGSGRITGKLSPQDEQQETERPEEWIRELVNAGQGDVTNPACLNCDARGTKSAGQLRQTRASHGGDDVANANCNKQYRRRGSMQMGRTGRQGQIENNGNTRGTQWSIEPDVGRVAHGVAARVDRLKAIGNGQVPAVVRLAWETLT